jgi:hypothetical protein
MKKPGGPGTQNECATTAEVVAAIESLSAEQYYRLKRFAQWRMRGIGRAALGRTHDSLLAQAAVSTFQGSESETKGRKWAKNRVPFVEHLFGAMRSISTHWKEAYERRGMEAELLDCEAATEDDVGNVSRPSDLVVDPAADPFRSCAAREALEALDNHFAGDDDALLVIEARKEGMSVAGMVADLGLTEKRVNAATQRIRYFLRRIL